AVGVVERALVLEGTGDGAAGHVEVVVIEVAAGLIELTGVEADRVDVDGAAGNGDAGDAGAGGGVENLDGAGDVHRSAADAEESDAAGGNGGSGDGVAAADVDIGGG